MLFWAYFRCFLHVYKCNFNIFVGKHLDMMYTSIEQFYWMLNEACGRSNDELYQKLCLKINACQGARNGSFGQNKKCCVKDWV
jgi:hypothetical protein